MATPVGVFVGAVIEIGTNDLPLPWTAGLARTVTWTLVASKANLSGQMASHVSCADIQQGLNKGGIRLDNRPSGTPAFCIMLVGKRG